MPNDTPRPRPVFNTEHDHFNNSTLISLKQKLKIDHLFQETSTREKNAKMWFQQMGIEGLKNSFHQLECKDQKESAARQILILELNAIGECFNQLQIDDDFEKLDQEAQKAYWDRLMEKIDSLNDFKKHLNEFNKITSYRYVTEDFMNVSYGIMRGVDALTSEAQGIGYTNYARYLEKTVPYLEQNRNNVNQEFQDYLGKCESKNDHIPTYLGREKRLKALEQNFQFEREQLSAKKVSPEKANAPIFKGLSDLQEKTLNDLDSNLKEIRDKIKSYTTLLDNYRLKKKAYDEIYEMDKGAREMVPVLQNHYMDKRIAEDLVDFEKRLGENKRFFHIDSSEYRALKNAVKNYKEHRNDTNLSAIKTAAEAYLAAKLKGRENDTSSTSMRDYRLNLARELRDYVQEKQVLLDEEREATQNLNDHIRTLEHGVLQLPLGGNGERVTKDRLMYLAKPYVSYSSFSEKLSKIQNNYQKGIEDLQKQGLQLEQNEELRNPQPEEDKMNQIDTSMPVLNQ